MHAGTKTMIDQGRAGGSREPCGAQGRMDHGRAEGAQSQGEADELTSIMGLEARGEAMGSTSQGKAPGGEAQGGAGELERISSRARGASREDGDSGGRRTLGKARSSK